MKLRLDHLDWLLPIPQTVAAAVHTKYLMKKHSLLGVHCLVLSKALKEFLRYKGQPVDFSLRLHFPLKLEVYVPGADWKFLENENSFLLSLHTDSDNQTTGLVEEIPSVYTYTCYQTCILALI